MRLFKRKSDKKAKAMIQKQYDHFMDQPVTPAIEKLPSKPPTSYIEIYTNKGNYHIRIRGGNNKIRFFGENMYSYSNAVRAARLFSKETGLRVVNRSAK